MESQLAELKVAQTAGGLARVRDEGAQIEVQLGIQDRQATMSLRRRTSSRCSTANLSGVRAGDRAAQRDSIGRQQGRASSLRLARRLRPRSPTTVFRTVAGANSVWLRLLGTDALRLRPAWRGSPALSGSQFQLGDKVDPRRSSPTMLSSSATRAPRRPVLRRRLLHRGSVLGSTCGSPSCRRARSRRCRRYPWVLRTAHRRVLFPTQPRH